MRRTSSRTNAVRLSETLLQLSAAIALADVVGPWCSQPLVPASFGWHQTVHIREALCPAATVSTIKRRAALNTRYSPQLRARPAPAFRT